jgi:hypothetical protein
MPSFEEICAGLAGSCVGLKPLMLTSICSSKTAGSFRAGASHPPALRKHRGTLVSQ